MGQCRALLFCGGDIGDQSLDSSASSPVGSGVDVEGLVTSLHYPAEASKNIPRQLREPGRQYEIRKSARKRFHTSAQSTYGARDQEVPIRSARQHSCRPRSPFIVQIIFPSLFGRSPHRPTEDPSHQAVFNIWAPNSKTATQTNLMSLTLH